MQEFVYLTWGAYHDEEDSIDLGAAESSKHPNDRDDDNEDAGSYQEVRTGQEDLLIDDIYYGLFLDFQPCTNANKDGS